MDWKLALRSNYVLCLKVLRHAFTTVGGACSERKESILQALALMLESKEGGARITTAKLAKQVGVSEAALYRHFPNKSAIFVLKY